MSIGNSGRIVIEIDPHFKRTLYSALAKDGMTLKDWFLREVQIYLRESGPNSSVYDEIKNSSAHINQRDRI